MSLRGRATVTLAAVTGALLLAVPTPVAGARAAVGDTSPVDLATHVDMADGMAHASAIVRAGDARVEVLSPTLLRLEYSPTATFENRPTVNAVDRRMPVPPYRSSVVHGVLTVKTADAELRYEVGTGPFTTRNTSVSFTDAGRASTVHPTWEWECTFDQVCQAGAASLGGQASIIETEKGYDSTAGYVGYLFKAGDRATWQVLGAPAGEATLSLRYSTFTIPAPLAHVFDLVVNGHRVTTLTAAPTGDNQWGTLTAPVALRRGTNAVEIRCANSEGCNTNLDTLSLAPVGSPAPTAPDTGPLGGWIRGFDTATYNTNPTCVAGQTPATCQAGLEPLHQDGLLDRAGWRLLDDSHSAVWTATGWVEPRAAHGDVEDGYLFVYGHDYAGALRTLEHLTGPAPLLPRNIFGVWYSDYTPYTSTTVEQVYKGLEANDVPLNVLSLDTDWKAPNDWDGWEWNPTFFPDPSSFLSWAKSQGIDVTLNIHSSIADNDPRLSRAESVAGGSLESSSCTSGDCKVWNWSSKAQAESNFSLQQQFLDQGVSFWWLDWCCDASFVSTHGVTPDSWIDHLYAQEMQNQGRRPFVLARLGSSDENTEEVYAAGPWSNHTSTVAFTGDAWGTWNTLAAEAELTSSEASIGEPYVSSDIGSFLGPPPSQSGADPPDLYDRWVQFGTFQPILRLHSNNETRLPFEYPPPVRDDTESFLRLREQLIPYTYTLAADARETGLPMARPLYLDYPGRAAAYDNPTEYLFGPDMLVAPVTTPGTEASTTLWFPPGRWVDYFTGAVYEGPTTATVTSTLATMPVFVRAGGIVTEQLSGAKHPTTSYSLIKIRDYPGAKGTFGLYDDAGNGLAYTKGEATTTPMTTTTHGDTTLLTVGRAAGHYRGEATSTTYEVEMVDVGRPTTVTLDGTKLSERSTTTAGRGWTYDTSTDSLVIDVGTQRAAHGFTLAEVGGPTVAGPQGSSTSR